MSQTYTKDDNSSKAPTAFALTFIVAQGWDKKSRRERTAAKSVYPSPRPAKQYDRVWLWMFHPKDYADHEAFAEALRKAAPMPKLALIRGAPIAGLDLKLPHRRLSAAGRKGRTIDDIDRNWAVFDIDGALVPTPFGDPDQLRAAAEWFRDNRLPPEFRDVKMIVAATASTGRRGPDKLHARLFVRVSYSLSNKDYKAYTRGVADKLGLELDASVCQSGQIIYTARPVFEGCADAVPPEDWVFVLDGLNDTVTLDLKKYAPLGKKAEARLARAQKEAHGSWRALAQATVGRRGDEIGDIANTFNVPLTKTLGLAARSHDTDETITDTLLALGAERGPARVDRYNREWMLDALRSFREKDEDEPPLPPRRETHANLWFGRLSSSKRIDDRPASKPHRRGVCLLEQ